MVAVRTEMDIESQVKSLMAQAAGDSDGQGEGAAGGHLPKHLREYVDGQRDRSALDPINIRQLIVPGAGNRRIFRILLTNACQYSCDYCPMRAQRSLPRHALEPEKLARLFMTAFRKGWCDGLFVTSGIPRSPVWAMDRILELVEILRVKMGYRGYLHVKALAGAEPGQVERLVRLVDRVSYNLESACSDTLATHAPEKTLEAGLAALRTVKKAVEDAESGAGSRPGRSGSDSAVPGRARKPSPARPSQTLSRSRDRSSGSAPVRSVLRSGATTQFVVGLGKETDRDLLTFTDRLIKEKLIHHPQFSAFRPIRETPMSGRPETPAIREHRLYQADHLVRDYGFKTEELPFGPDGSLPLDTDPKLQWALIHPELFPVELQTASREELRRVPGFGPISVERFLSLRSRVSGIDLSVLKKLGVVVSRAAGFVTWCGRALGNRFRQAALFDSVSAFPQKTYEFSPGTFR